MNHDNGLGGVSADTLLSQESWLRELIGRLVGESEVDDVIQDTWLEVVKKPVDVNGSFRGWLRTVALRLALRSRRSRRRRSRREQQVAVSGEAPPVDRELVGNELRQQVIEAVLGLSEPYRSTVLARFYQGESATEIARATRTPVATVRIRLQRGVQHLRADLSRRCGPDWRPALAAFAWPAMAGGAVSGFGRSVPVLTAMAVACVLVAVSLAVGSDPVATEFAAADVVPIREPAASLVDTSPDTMRRRLTIARPAETPSRAVVGRVVDPRGQPIPNVPIRFQRLIGKHLADRAGWRLVAGAIHDLGVADRDGRFRLRCPLGAGGLCAGGDMVSLCIWPVGRSDNQVFGARIVATGSAKLQGTVVDRVGRPLAGVRIVVRCDRLPEFPEILDRQMWVTPIAETDTASDGRFALPRFPLGCRARLRVSTPGYRQHELVPNPRDPAPRIVLVRSTPNDPLRIAGRVFDLRGQAVDQAVVGVGDCRTRTDAGGTYSLELVDVAPDAILYAGKKGYTTAVERRIAEQLSRWRGGTLVVDLTLGRRPQKISGVLLDGDGGPIPDYRVFLSDPLFLGASTRTAEALAAGRDRDEFGASDVADAGGSFSIGGLYDRLYKLRIYDPSAAAGMDVGSYSAGSRHVEVRIRENRYVTMHGRIVDDDGHGVGGARVFFGGAVHRRQLADSTRLREPAITDRAGGFVLRRLPREGGTVYVVGRAGDGEVVGGIVPTIVKLAASDLREPELTVTVARLCHFRVFAPHAPDGSTVHLLDDYGNRIEILFVHATGCRHHEAWTLDGGSTQVLCASQRARTIVLVGPDGLERERAAIQLDPDLVTEIEL